MRILIAEDTENSRVFLKDYLEGVGYTVLVAEDGKEALRLSMSSDIDLIISDILMPELDGYELCRRLKANSMTRHIPVIFFTATYTEEQDKQLGLSIGACRYLIKPCEPDWLMQEIQAVLEEKEYTKASVVSNEMFGEEYVRVLSRKLDKKVIDLKLEKELADRLSRKIETINDAIPSLISQLDADFRYLYVNAAYESWHQVDKKDVLGRSVRSLVGDKAYAVIEPFLLKALQGEKVFFETEVYFRNDQVRFIQGQYIPNVDSNGNVVGIYSIVTDITDKHLAEMEQAKLQRQLQQAQKLELIGQLTGGVAHDFNNILTVISGYTNMSLAHVRRLQDDTLEQYLSEVDAASTRARNVISQLLAFCRGSGQEPTRISISRSIREITTLLKPAIPSTVVIETDLEAGDGPFVNINAVQFDQIIMNLCINAKDAMSQRGNLKISVKTKSVEGLTCASCLKDVSGTFVDVEIRDSGSGIPEADIIRIFEPFYTTKVIGEGTGLGLAMTHGIVHENGGHIIVKSQVNEGTSMHIMLPQASSADVLLENHPMEIGVY